MAGQPQMLALDGGDPTFLNSSDHKESTALGITNVTHRQLKSIHDPSVSFEEYLYYAKITRASEEGLAPGIGFVQGIKERIGGKRNGSDTATPPEPAGSKEEGSKGVNEKDVGKGESDGSTSPTYLAVSDDEWIQASRATRTATWGAIFYLITTDILGPFSVPWAMSQMGYGPGVVLYTVFGAFAGYSGWQLWKMFLNLDSDRFPLKTYGDIAFRVYGMWCRNSVSILQSIQLLFNVGAIIISNSQSLAQVTKAKLCFIVCCVIWSCLGFILGQIRTLQRFGWIAHAAIWLNVIVMFITMVSVAITAPNYTAAYSQNMISKGPVVTTAGPPSGMPFESQVVGLMQAVYSYGGAMLFCEFMSEMRRPWDFWKGMVCAQSFIFVWYLFFGLFVYSYQGQFSINPAYSGIGPYNPQTAANVIAMISALIAAALYGNIGIKVLYQNVLIDVFNAPPLTATRGKVFWVFIVPVYWIIAWIVATAIPQFSNLTGLIAALCILQFTYTFPPFLMLGFQIKKDAIQDGEGYDPATGRVTRYDTGFRRWCRGYAVKWHLNTFNLIYTLGALVCAVLGAYSAIKDMITGFQDNDAVTSFGCTSPVGG